MPKRIDVSEVIQVLKETGAIIENFNQPVSKIGAEIICNHRISMRGF